MVFYFKNSFSWVSLSHDKMKITVHKCTSGVKKDLSEIHYKAYKWTFSIFLNQNFETVNEERERERFVWKLVFSLLDSTNPYKNDNLSPKYVHSIHVDRNAAPVD